MPVGARLAIAVLVAGWTVTLAVWPTEDDALAHSAGRTADGLWPCGTVRDFDGSTYAATEIKVDGLGCYEARGIVREAEEACRLEDCDFGRWECTAGDAEDAGAFRTTTCSFVEERRVIWSWVET
jgi:hypothetical protein